MGHCIGILIVAHKPTQHNLPLPSSAKTDCFEMAMSFEEPVTEVVVCGCIILCFIILLAALRSSTDCCTKLRQIRRRRRVINPGAAARPYDRSAAQRSWQARAGMRVPIRRGIHPSDPVRVSGRVSVLDVNDIAEEYFKWKAVRIPSDSDSIFQVDLDDGPNEVFYPPVDVPHNLPQVHVSSSVRNSTRSNQGHDQNWPGNPAVFFSCFDEFVESGDTIPNNGFKKDQMKSNPTPTASYQVKGAKLESNAESRAWEPCFKEVDLLGVDLSGRSDLGGKNWNPDDAHSIGGGGEQDQRLNCNLETRKVQSFARFGASEERRE